MAIVEDASAPAAKHSTTGTPFTTAAFSPPANSLIVALVAADGAVAGTSTATVTDSGGHTWTLLKRQNTVSGSALAGTAEVWCMFTTTALTSITVTATIVGHPANGSDLVVKVLTGASATQTGATAGLGSSSTTAQTSITTTTAGAHVYGAVINWKNSTAYTLNGSTTSVDAFADTTNGDWYAAFKATAAVTTPGATTLGYTTTAAAANMALAEILPAAGTTPITGADTSSETESGSTAVTLAGSDTGSTADASSVAVATAGLDTGTQVDTGTLGVSTSGTDTSSSTETGASLAASAVGTDSSSENASQTVAAALGSLDTTVATEAAVGTNVTLGMADVGEAVDSASLAVDSTADDTTGVSELSAVVASLATTDEGISSEFHSLTAALSGLDTGVGADTASLTAEASGGDTGDLAEASSLAVHSSGTDTSSLDEGASIVVTLSSADAGGSIDTGNVQTPDDHTDTDLGRLAEDGTTVVSLNGHDSTQLTETGSVTASLSSSDSSTAVDTDSLGVPVVSSDATVLTESQSVAAHLGAIDGARQDESWSSASILSTWDIGQQHEAVSADCSVFGHDSTANTSETGSVDTGADPPEDDPHLSASVQRVQLQATSSVPLTYPTAIVTPVSYSGIVNRRVDQ